MNTTNNSCAATDKMPPSTSSLFADLYLERLSGEKICAWAVSALEAGFDSPALRMLAGMSLERRPDFFGAEPYFRTALDELQIPIPGNKELALRSYARTVAEDIVLGRISPRQALDDIHSAVVIPLNHPADLMGWCHLWEGNNPDGSSELPRSALEQVAREFAKKWLANEATQSHKR